MDYRARKQAFSLRQIVVRKRQWYQHAGQTLVVEPLAEGKVQRKKITDVRDEVASQQGATRP